jgi:hypothetical protein
MSRVRLIVTAAIVASGTALAGCSSFSMPSWLSSTPSAPVMQTLQFESNPPGADVRTTQGQTCQTPCSLAVPTESQSVTFAKNGFLPQTVQVNIGEPAEHSFFESAPPTLTPNPVEVALQAAAPPRRPPPPVMRKPRKPAPPPRPQPAPGSAFPAPPPQQQPGGSPFPPPPPPQQQ